MLLSWTFGQAVVERAGVQRTVVGPEDAEFRVAMSDPLVKKLVVWLLLRFQLTLKMLVTL